jgi:hypothetical protein
MRTLPIKSRILIVFSVTAVVVLCVFSYRAYHELYNVTLESDLISDFKVEQLRDTSPITLKMSGQPMYSGMIVRKVTTKTRGRVMVVTAHLALVGLARPITPGQFQYQLTVPESVDEIRFGTQGTPVWKRNER